MLAPRENGHFWPLFAEIIPRDFPVPRASALVPGKSLGLFSQTRAKKRPFRPWDKMTIFDHCPILISKWRKFNKHKIKYPQHLIHF